jgi:ubiquinone/menaquinone biosynthesis C-methylase UbiE
LQPKKDMGEIENQTGELFGDLWHRYSDAQFKHSAELFAQRWRANGERPDFFRGKACLDIGCGGGRYSFAMALLGATKVIGVDIGESGLNDAAKRKETMGCSNVEFRQASALKLPFSEATFDFVCCSGVLHHTLSVEHGLAEIRRVLRPGGSAYLLLYGSGGLYWPLNLITRAFAHHLGYPEVDRCCASAGFAPAKRRTILDDLFVPVLETYTNERVECLLKNAGFARWRRWPGGQMDHEESPESLVKELEQREHLWRAGSKTAPPMCRSIELCLAEMCKSTINAARSVIDQAVRGKCSADEERRVIIGCGHHRIIAEVP